MEVCNEYLVGNWTISSSIINFLLITGRRARIYLVSTNGESELVDFLNFEVAPKKLVHKSIHIHNLAIVGCPESCIM